MSNITNQIFPTTTSYLLLSEQNQKNAEYDIRRNGFDPEKDYGMRTREEHLKLLEFVIKSTPLATAQPVSREVLHFFEYLRKHTLFNDLELATLVAKRNPKIVLELLRSFQITEESDRYKVMEIIVESCTENGISNSKLISNFSKFTITNPLFIKNFINLLFNKNLSDKKVVEELFHFFLCKFNFSSEKDKYEIGEYLTQLDPCTAIKYLERVTFKDQVCLKNWLVLLVSLSMFGLERKPFVVIPPRRIVDYFTKINEGLDKHQIAKSALEELLTKINSTELKDVIKIFIAKNEKYRNKDIQSSLSIHFLSQLCASVQYLKVYKNLITNASSKEQVISHLLLPAVVMASWVDVHSDLQMGQKVIELLSMREVKLNLKSSTGIMQILLKTFLIIEKKNLSSLSNYQKLYCIYEAIRSSIDENKQKKFDEKKCKSSLNVLYSSITQRDLFKQILEELPKDYVFQDFVTEFTKKAEDMLSLGVTIDNFIDKYNEFESKMRIPGTCIMYVGNLQSLDDPSLIKDIQKLVHGMLNNRIQQERYSTHDNPHLATIKEKFSTIFSKWQVSLEPKELEIDSKKPLIAVDTDDPQDVFLCGTEVDGSCQRIDGDPHLNKGLIAYILDGKNRLLAIKDKESGKIYSRCLLRLLLDEETKEPVLFQDCIYPESSPYTDQLNDLAKTKAEQLQLPLYSCNYNSYKIYKASKKAITSLGNSLTYEYVDEQGGNINNGKFTICAPKVF